MKEEESFSRLFLGFVKVTGFLPGLLLFKPKVNYVNKKVQSRKLPHPLYLYVKSQITYGFCIVSYYFSFCFYPLLNGRSFV